MHWGTEGVFGSGVDISVLERILGIQKIVLGHCLSPSTLARLENQQLQTDTGANPLRMEEVFRSLTDGIWSDLDRLPKPGGDKTAKCPLDHSPQPSARIRSPAGHMVLGNNASSAGDLYSYIVFQRGAGSSVPADARALARLHLKEISGRIAKVLETSNLTIDDTSRAHLEECRHRIAKVLEANLDVRRALIDPTT